MTTPRPVGRSGARARRRAILRISDPILNRALTHLLDERDQPPTHQPPVIGDEDAKEPVDLLVIEPTPLAGHRAVERVRHGSTRGVITVDALDDLHDALAAIANDVVYLPHRVITLARHLPRLSERDIRILKALMIGHSNTHLARMVGISEATLKRSLARLLTELGVTDRSGLVVAALELGLKPGCGSHDVHGSRHSDADCNGSAVSATG